VLQELVRDEYLWTLSQGRAIDRVLEVGLSGIGNHVVTVWCFLEHDVEMVCIARRERDTGYRKPEGRLRESDYPAYFEALRREACIAADDALHDPRTRDLVAPYLEPLGVHALLDANLRQEGRVFGVVCFEQLHETRAWSEAERDFAVEISGVINQLLLIGELRRRNKLLRMLNSIAPRLGRDHTVQDLARVALDTLREEFGDVWAAFLEVEPDGTHCRMLGANARGFPEAMLHRLQRFELAGTALGRALDERRIVVEAMNPADAHPLEVRREAVQTLGLRSVISIPLIHAGRVLGGIVLWLRENGWLGASELDAYESISTTVSVAFANAMYLRELRHKARHDELTGLANRDQLFEDLAGEADIDLTLVTIDLRDFRQINDTLGRALADRVLVEVAARLLERVRPRGGSAYRFAGAEFGVLLRAPGADRGSIVAELQAAVAAPFELGGLHLMVLAQCGIARARAPLPDPGQLVRQADIALGWAKLSEGGIAEYDGARDIAGPRNLELLADLRVALREGELEMHFQPKISLHDARVVGCEALLRWKHPRHGNIPPDRFIAVAETGNLMRELTLWVAGAAMRAARALRDAGCALPVAINASVHNLVDGSFPAALAELLVRHGCAAGDIRLEITETVLMRDPERALPVIRELAGAGIALVARLPAPDPAVGGEDRPHLHPGDARAPGGRGHRDLHGRPRARPRAGGGGRGRGGCAHAGAPARARLRRRAGLSHRAADAPRGVDRVVG
jgi:diguanylate cyclase (GGDEF)-like protein